MRKRPARVCMQGGARERELAGGESMGSGVGREIAMLQNHSVLCTGCCRGGLGKTPAASGAAWSCCYRGAVQERGLDLGLRGSRKIVCATAAARPARRLQCASAVDNNAH